MLPAQRRQLDWTFDPLTAVRRWPRDRRIALLHSGRFDARWARRTILASPSGTFAVEDTPQGPQSHWRCERGTPAPVAFAHRPFRDTRQVLQSAPDALWLGYFSYDLGRHIERLPSVAADDRHWPLIELGRCPGWLEYDLQSATWHACGEWAEELPIELRDDETLADFTATELRGVFNRADYEAAVQRVIDYIAAGDIFQANLTQRFSADFAGPHPDAARSAFCRLAGVSPAWYGALLELFPTDDGRLRSIASTSPELFLESAANGCIITRPIKGTRPASVSAEVLRDSEKDTAELNMIVDLMRNDLGRVCGYGSVRVTQPRVIESHPTIHHGVATIAGRLHASKDVVDLLRAAIPGGSITGAPKVRAMQIIDELERVRRGPYCGAIGWITAEAMTLNIAIRTMLIEQHGKMGRVDFAVGGGIVADSTPQAEYDETIDKAAAILTTLRLKAPNC